MMNIQTRAKYKKALRAGNIPTKGLSDAELEREFNALESGQQDTMPAPAPAPIEVQDTPKEAPKKAPKTKANVLPINSNVEQIASLLASLNSGGIDETRVLQLIEQHAKQPRAIEVTLKEAPEINTKKVELAHKSLQEALTMASAGVNVYLVGPAGTGKTTLAKQVSECLNTEFFFTGAVLQKYELLGFVDAAGEYQSTPFYHWCKNGGVFLFDEIDASQAGALVAFNAALANGLCVFPNGETVELHANCVCFAAANTFGQGSTRQYSGRNPIDAATLDRFCMLELGYDVELERELCAKVYLENGGTSDHDIEISNTVLAIRKKAEQERLTIVVSTRAMLKAAALCGRGMAINRALEAALYASLTADQRKVLGV